MFDIGWSELLVIAVVALVFIGPKELPGVLRNISHWMGKIRRMASEFQSQFQEAMREAEMEDLKKHADDLNNAARALSKPFDPADYLGKLDTPAADTSAGAPAAGVEAAASKPEAGDPSPAAGLPTAQPAPEPPAAEASTDARPTPEAETATPAAGTAEAGGRAA